MLLQVQKKDLLRYFSHYYANEVTNIAAIKQFALACWLVARARAFHQLWLSDTARSHPELVDAAFVEQFLQNVSKPWQQVSEFAYILFRRVSQGRRAPDTCFQILEMTISPNEVRLATQLLEKLMKHTNMKC